MNLVTCHPNGGHGRHAHEENRNCVNPKPYVPGKDPEATQATRRDRAEDIIEMICNSGVEIPEKVGRYLAIEKHGGDHIWGIFADTLDELASELDSSDTDRDTVLVHDLDTRHELSPITQTVAFLNYSNSERIEVKRA
jgi:hypothetical protein